MRVSISDTALRPRTLVAGQLIGHVTVTAFLIGRHCRDLLQALAKSAGGCHRVCLQLVRGRRQGNLFSLISYFLFYFDLGRIMAMKSL